MGSYLSEPITEKFSTEELSALLACGASSMQGWRVSQEDAHNCILDYDKNTSFFAVYDGHGGHEVAVYCSQELPGYLKSLESYKAGNYEKALEEAFLGFDGSIATDDVIKVLKELAKDKDADDDSDEDEENVNHLYEEATMPIEQVIGKYTSNLLGRTSDRVASLKDEKPSSPILKAKSSSASSSSGEGSSGVCSSTSGVKTESEEAVSSSSSVVVKQEAAEAEAEVKQENGHKVVLPQIVVDSTGDAIAVKQEIKEEEVADEVGNGEKVASVSTTAPTPAENGTPKKGKATAKTKGVDAPAAPPEAERRARPKRSVRQMYAKLLDASAPPASDSDSDDDDDSDKTFEVKAEKASDSDDDDDADGAEEEVEFPIEEMDNYPGDSEFESSSDDGEECDDDEEDEATAQFAKDMVEEPGSDSGCTAVVALLREGRLYVANAGDSRCIVCRGGKAIDMSVDHKPEDQPERERIVRAGGRVTADGRVNGGLNLSRAIGDHGYKQNKALGDREQMITALPDVRVLDIDERDDEFMVLACDGIWNFMSSQEVVDFVRPALRDGVKLSKICEEIFDHCLAPNTMGDGTGCDNMTAIIVEFRKAHAGVKRAASEGDAGADGTKRAKTEDGGELPSTTSAST